MNLIFYFLTFILVVVPFSIVNVAWAATYVLQDNNAGTGHQVSVSDTVNAVLRSHKSLKASQESRQAAAYELKASRASYGPRLDLTADSGFTNEDSDRSQTTANAYYTGQVSLLLTQPLWDGYATRGRVEASESTLESTSSRVIDNATNLALDGIISHISLITLKKNLQLAHENLRQHQDILVLISDREDSGADTRAELTQTQGRLTRAYSNLEDAKAALMQGQNAYTRNTSMPVPQALGPVRQPPKMFTDSQTVLEIAKTHNPEAIAYLADIRTARAEQEVMKADFSPTINLEAGVNYSNRNTSSYDNYYSDDEWEPSMDVMVVMRWNLYNSGADLAEVRAANASVREAHETAYNFYDDLTLQIEDSWVDYKTAISQFRSHKKAIEYNKQTRDLYLEQFRVGGQRSLLDVLDAESELYNSEVLAVTAHANILISAYTLYALAGKLLPELGVNTELILKAAQAN